MGTSYKITGIEPPDLAGYPADVRKQFWGWVVELGIKAKIQDILAGLDKDGKPLRPINAKTRKHRRSEMTPSGKGDPLAPPLIPGHQKSRTASLLAGRPLSHAAEFFWRYDAFTGDSWGKILRIQARKGRDVIGISPRALAWVRSHAWAKWAQYKAGTLPAAKKRAMAAVGIPQIGDYETEHATYGIGASSAQHFKKGQWTGGMTADEWRKYFRGTATATLPGRPSNPASRSPISGPGYNRLIAHTWGQGPGPGRGGSAAPPTPRPGPRKPGGPTKPPAPPKPVNPPVNRIAKHLKPPKPQPPPPAVVAPKTGEPFGKPVSDGLTIPSGKWGERFQKVVDLIDKIHGDGELNKIPVLVDSAKARNGAFYPKRENGKLLGVKITVSRNGDHQEMTFAHEIGHFIEMVGIPGSPQYGYRDWNKDPLFAEWKAITEKSEAVLALKDLRTKYKVQVTTDAGPRDYIVDSKYVGYNLKHNELWARSYAQYVALKSGDPAMREQLAKLRDPARTKVYHAVQWADDDFKPIAEAMDRLFQKIGWRT